jgi:hypothetical protein
MLLSPLDLDFVEAEQDGQADTATTPVTPPEPFAASFRNPSQRQVNAAPPLDLNLMAGTEGAVRVTEAVVAAVLDWEAQNRPRKRRRKPTESDALRRSVETIVGGLLRPWARRKRTITRCTSDKSHFSG